ncbi:MAG: asparagine synthetase B family protein [Deltaproteobacteria bacterium]
MTGIYGSVRRGEVSISGAQSYAPEENISVACDGEIYNAAELRGVLKSQGRGFNLESEARLIAQVYSAWGEAGLARINGGISYALYDGKSRSLLLARDKVGKIPLYYSDYGGALSFSTEVKSIALSPGFPRELDLRALNFYLAYRYIPGDLCIFKYIKKLPAGYLLRLDVTSAAVEIKQRWEAPMSESPSASEDDLLAELERVLLTSLEERLGGERVGAFLSGGLDSSLLVAMATKILGAGVKTFSIGYRGGKFDETPFARSVSKYLRTDHREFIAEPDIDALIKSASCFDEPHADPSIIPTYFGARLAKERVDAVISGDGADGLFLGLRTHYLSAKYERRRRILSPISGILRQVSGIVPEGVKLKMFLENLSPEEFYMKRRLIYGAGLRKNLLRKSALDEIGEGFYDPEALGFSILDSYRGSFRGKIGYATFMSEPDNVLFKMEKISKSLELAVRFPFLDTRLIELALGKTPGDMKIQGGVQKYLLKKLARKYLPPDFAYERKRGFNPPLSKWISGKWRGFTRDLLLGEDNDYFDRGFIEKILRRHGGLFYDEGRRIFTLLVFRLWERKYLKGGAP